jgi:hypothetical protein
MFEAESLFFIVTVFAALGVGAFVKGVAGVGLPLVSVPVLASVLGVDHAVAIMVVPSISANLWLLWIHRAAAASRELGGLALSGVLGIVAGSWLLAHLPRETMFLVLAAWLGLYLAFRGFKPGAGLSDRAGLALAPGVGLVSGTLQGSTGFSFPIFGPYLQSRRLGPAGFAFNSAILLLIFTSTQIVSLTGLGLLTWGRVGEGLFALIPMALFMPLGMRAARSMGGKSFDRVVSGLLAATALVLAYRGFSAL